MTVMSQTGAVVPALTRWGVSADADLVYRALLLTGPASERDLTRDLGIARQRARGAVDELTAMRAAVFAPCASRRGERVFAARPVGEVLGRLRRPRPVLPPRQRWGKRLAAVEGLDLTVLEGVAVRRWPTRAAARWRVAQLVAAEQYEQLTINSEEVISAESWAAGLPLDRSLRERGIRVRVLSRPPTDGDRAVPGLLPRDTHRQLPDLPLKLLVFDRRVALLPANPLDLEEGYVEVAEPGVLQRLCEYFHRLWLRGRDPFRQGVPPINLTARERALLTLLSAGHTDASAAEQLRVSVRTVAYTMRALMDRLGVDNRFQLALLLGAAGTLPPPAQTTDPRISPAEDD